MSNLRQRINDIAIEVEGDVQYGECFYDKGMLDTFIGNLEEENTEDEEY